MEQLCRVSHMDGKLTFRYLVENELQSLHMKQKYAIRIFLEILTN